jgi:hypothetical protein
MLAKGDDEIPQWSAYRNGGSSGATEPSSQRKHRAAARLIPQRRAWAGNSAGDRSEGAVKFPAHVGRRELLKTDVLTLA